MDELDEISDFVDWLDEDEAEATIPIPVLFLSILQASQGTYSPAEVEDMYLIIQAYMEDAPAGQVVAIKGGKDDAK